jgi:hypothetical protein
VIVVPAVRIHSPGYIAEADAQAKEQLWPHYRISSERGWPPITPAEFEREIAIGSL